MPTQGTVGVFIGFIGLIFLAVWTHSDSMYVTRTMIDPNLRVWQRQERIPCDEIKRWLDPEVFKQSPYESSYEYALRLPILGVWSVVRRVLIAWQCDRASIRKLFTKQ